MAGQLKIGGNVIATHAGTEGAGTVTLDSSTLAIGSNTNLENITLPAGSVLQVKESNLKDEFQASQASGFSFGTAAGREDQSYAGVVDDLSLTLTTKGANSSFFISVHLNQCSNSDMDGSNNMAAGVFYSIDSYANPLSQGNAVGSRSRVTFGNWLRYGGDDWATFDMGCQIHHTSSLAKGATLSYRTVLTSAYTTPVLRINRDKTDTNSYHYYRGVSTFRVMEIAT